MIDINEVAQIFARNVDNKLTLELANGMISEIIKLVQKSEEANKAKQEDQRED